MLWHQANRARRFWSAELDCISDYLFDFRSTWFTGKGVKQTIMSFFSANHFKNTFKKRARFMTVHYNNIFSIYIYNRNVCVCVRYRRKISVHINYNIHHTSWFIRSIDN